VTAEGVKQLEKSLWAVRVKRVEARTGKQRNRRATVHGTRADAIRVRDRLRDELASTASKPKRLRFSEYVIAWLARRVLKRGTRRKYEYELTHINPVLGELYLDSITSADVSTYLARRLTEAAGNTVLNELRLLRTIARDAVAEQLSARYWCDRVKAPKVAHYTDDNPNLLTPEQAARVLMFVPPQWLGIVLFVMTSGLRFGEVSALNWSDLDRNVGVARIRRSNYRGTEESLKTDGSWRSVAALPEIVALWGVARETGLVFATRRGTMHRGSPLRSVLDKACARAGVQRVTTHGLRRTFNDAGRKLGAREVLQSLTGHATEEMTDHYSHISSSEKTALARAVASAIGVLAVSATPTTNGDK
jgi:integrase